MAFNKSAEMLEEFAVDDTGAFGRIRNVLKETGDMFLFGKPTVDILHIMTKLYHENIVKNLSFRGEGNMSPSARGALDGRRIENLQFMCGIIQMDDGEIYITISEAPALEINGKKRVEDTLFEKKEKILDQLLKSCNIKVKYPEESSLATTTFGTHSRDDFKINWRHGEPGKPAAGVLNPAIAEVPMKSKTDLKEGTDEKDGGGKYNEFVLNKHILTNKTDDSSVSMNYNNDLWKNDYEVNMINSYEYLSKRMTQGKSFAPFKKYKYDEPSVDIECNNGSTCTESKLFSYVYNDLKKEFKDIDGFAVFWVGNSLPQHHHIKGYCYSPWIDKENRKLNGLRDDCLKIIMEGESKKGKPKPEYISDEKFKDVLKDVVQPIAMACPGCYSNYLKYKTGIVDTKWDQKGCYLKVSPRTARAESRAKAIIAKAAAEAAAKAAKATAAKATAAKAAEGGGEPTTTVKLMTNDEAYAAAENNVYGNTFLNWGANERASVKKLRALRAQSKKTKHKGGNRTHKRKNQKRRNTRRLKRHHNV